MEGFKKYRLLVVDDEGDLRDLLTQILASKGYDVVTASDGDEAIGILRKESFDAALLDILMPKRNGFDVLKHIRQHHPGTKSIMVTGFTDLQAAIEARQLGAAEYITKPYKLEMVISTLERLLSPPALP